MPADSNFFRYTAATGTTTEHSARTGLEFALQARRAVDIDNPSIEGLQTLLLLSQTFFAHGMGKKAYMTFCAVFQPSTYQLFFVDVCNPLI